MQVNPLQAPWNQATDGCPHGRLPTGAAAPGADLTGLIDFRRLHEFFDNFLEVLGLPIAVIDLQGQVLASSRWRRLCMEFHRANDHTRTGCLLSDTMLSKQIEAGTQCAVYRCANGLIDCATPIFVDGLHVANLFTGQFLLEAPDLDYFRRLQATHGFDREAYFEALAEIPILPEPKIPFLLKLLRGLAEQIGTQSLTEKRFLSILADAEEQVAANVRKMRERVQHFRSLLERVPLGQLLIDPHSLQILECNQAAADIYGCSRREACQSRVIDFDVALGDDAIQALREHVLTEGQAQFETRVQRRDGEMRDLMITAVLLPSADGDLLHMTHLDVTDRKQAAAEEKRLNRRLQLLSESNDALLHADSEETLLPEICRLLVETGGYRMAWVGFAESNGEKSVRPVAQAGDAAGYLDNISVSWADTEAGRGPTGTAIRTGRPQIAACIHSHPGLEPWREAAMQRGYRSSIALPLLIEGHAIGALSVYGAEPDAFGADEVRLLEKLANNLAFGIERLRTRAQLAAANRELQGFTYAASHDMKAPLSRIVSFTTLLERHYRERLEGDGLLFIDFIRDNAIRLSALIEDLLKHAQIEQQVLQCQAMDLQSAVAAILQEKEEDIRAIGAELRVELPPIRIHANAVGLAQVLRNIVDNALKYSAQASPPIIEIGCRQAQGACLLWIRDNGIGFDLAYREQIFQIFRRLHTYKDYPGSGVGLALVKKAMGRMGGKVWAESEPGKGAAFFLEFRTADRLPK